MLGSGRQGPTCQTGPTCASPEGLFRASHSPVAVAPWPHHGRQPQVSDLDHHVLVQEEVSCQSGAGAGYEGRNRTPAPPPAPATRPGRAHWASGRGAQSAADQAPQVEARLGLRESLRRLQDAGQRLRPPAAGGHTNQHSKLG